MSDVRCHIHLSDVRSDQSPVTCHMSEKATVRAADLPPPLVSCHVSLDRYQVSHVRCHIPVLCVFCWVSCHTSYMLEKATAKSTIDPERCHVILVLCQVSYDRCNASCVRCLVPLVRIRCHVSDFRRHVSQVNCQIRHRQSYHPPPNQLSFIV